MHKQLSVKKSKEKDSLKRGSFFIFKRDKKMKNSKIKTTKNVRFCLNLSNKILRRKKCKNIRKNAVKKQEIFGKTVANFTKIWYNFYSKSSPKFCALDMFFLKLNNAT